MALRSGMMVTASVCLVEKLGEGGMGSVWAADHLSLKTRVAVKFISPELFQQSPELAQRFDREASLAAQIKSPHVVQIFDHGRMGDGTPFIVMELLEGESLEDRLAREGKLGLRESVAIVSQAAKALGRAHKLGIVHRDIKPANLFLIESEYELFVKVLDFGIAKQTGTAPSGGLTATGAIIGTPEFMSPEQLLDTKGAGFQADLWALAVVAYEALTGQMPFRGDTVAGLIIAINKAELTAPSELCPELPAEVDVWFRRALSRDVQRRFGSAKEMALALMRISRPSAPELDDALLSTTDHGLLDELPGASRASGGLDEPGTKRSPLPVIKGMEALGPSPQAQPKPAGGGDEAAHEPTLPGPLAAARDGGRAQAVPPARASGPGGTLVSDASGLGPQAGGERGAQDLDLPEPSTQPRPPRAAEPRAETRDTLSLGGGPTTLQASASTLHPAGVPRRMGRGALAAIAALALLAAGAAAIALGPGSSVAPASSGQAPAGSMPAAASASAEPTAPAASVGTPAASASAAPSGATAAGAAGSAPAGPGPRPAPSAPGKGAKGAERYWGF
ncbi:MAG: protein kinase [Deltaproteobacteria bacterium]|nr:protein kinase [Deltaproteobacteria bacterium]